MISLLHILANSPSNGSLVWDAECPAMERQQLIPQADLLRLDPKMESSDTVLFIPPISGHSSSLIQDLAKPNAQKFDVHVLDWNDPAFLYSEDADYGIDCQILGIRSAIELLLQTSPKVHVVAICQSASPTLIALDGMQSPNLTLTLLAAPIFDAPGGVFDLFINDDIAKETINKIRRMTSRTLNGTSILPGSTQLAAIFNGSGGALRALGVAMTQECLPTLSGTAQRANLRRISLLDSRNIPEKLLLEGLRSNFIDRDHLRTKLDPRIPVHLIAGQEDEVVPSEQTFRFGEYFPRKTIVFSLLSGLDHFDLFAGSIANTEVSQKMSSFFNDPENLNK